MHLHNGSNHDCSNQHECIRQVKSRYQYNWLHLPICDHFLDQTSLCELHDELYYTRIDDKQLPHPWYPKNHHRQFPSGHHEISPLFLLRLWSHQPIVQFLLKWKYLRQAHQHLFWLKLKGKDTISLPGVAIGVYLQTTPTSSQWKQLWLPHPLWRHSAMLCSSPTQWTSSSQIWDGKAPKPYQPQQCVLQAPSEYPIMRQITLASSIPQESSQIVPQVPFRYNSTRPWLDVGPDRRRTPSSGIKRSKGKIGSH